MNPAIFHGAAGALFAPPGRLSNQDRNLRLCKSRHLLARLAVLPSSCEKASTMRETHSGSHGLTKVSLRPFLTNHTVIAGFRPTSTPKHLGSRERSKRSSIHTQTSPALFSIITFGRRVQPSHGAIETPPRSLSSRYFSRSFFARFHNLVTHTLVHFSHFHPAILVFHLVFMLSTCCSTNDSHELL